MEPKNSKEELFESRLKKLAADFDFFAHVTSHDLRDPLRQARIYSDELIHNLQGEDKKKLELINSSIDQILDKIAILRDYSYVTNDKSIHAPVDINNSVNEALQELDSKIKAAAAQIRISPLPTLNGNKTHLKRLFLFLIDNAIKFRSLNVGLKISISAVEENDLWHFMIMDNGIGLDKVYRELVFVLFQKIDTEAKDDCYGTGLAFAKKIVENHGGEIWYESDGESGTIFHFTLK